MSVIHTSILVEELRNWVKDYFIENGPDCKAVIGISGGKDSSVAAALMVDVLGKDRVFGVLMPQGSQKDIQDAYDLVNHLGINRVEINIGNVCHDLICQIGDKMGEVPCSQLTTNLPARIRMTTLYAIAAQVHGRVVNTCNLSEDYVGYSTKFGDSAGDFSPFSNLTSDEVIEIGRYFHLPEHLLVKAPADGLSGLTDEDNLGFSYQVLNEYLRDRKTPDYDTLKNIEQRRKNNLHKLQQMPSYMPSRKAIESNRKGYWSDF